MDSSRLVFILGEIVYDTDSNLLTLAHDFNGKQLVNTIKFTKEGEVVKCDLNNIYSAAEYTVIKQIDHCKLSDEQLEVSFKADLIQFVHALLKTRKQLIADGYELNTIWKNKAAIVVTDEFATIAMYFDAESFALEHPEAYMNMPDKDKVVGFAVSSDHAFSIALGKDGEVVSFVHHGE